MWSRDLHRSVYEATRETLATTGQKPDELDLVIVEADAGHGPWPYHIFAEPNSWLPARKAQNRLPQEDGAGSEILGDPTGMLGKLVVKVFWMFEG